MSNLPETTSPVYATDEDIAVRAGGDYVTLCPPWQQMASGADGAFTSAAPWVLTSTATNFAANAVQPNQVVWLSQPKANFPGGGALFAIDSVSGTSLVLRRLHKDLNVGQAPVGGANVSGITFAINTLDPQTEEASFDIKRRFGIDETIVDRTSAWVFDLRDLRMATVLTVLQARYTQEARTDKGDFARKINLIKGELQQVLDRVQIRWGPFGNSAEPSTLFSCKLSR
ncbi:MAG: hypothetical protein ACYDCP_09995 [Thermoplasmataceae archaeon]